MLQYEHLDQNEGSVDGGEDALDCVLLRLAVLIYIGLLFLDSFENDSVRTYRVL